MDAHDLVRSVRAVGAAHTVRAVRSSWRRRRADAAALGAHGGERARLPGAVLGTEVRPGGGVIRFTRSSLWVRVAVGGAVFCGWDGAGPEPSYALRDITPQPDARAELEPDKQGGWRVVSERVLVTVSRDGVVEVRTPGGALLRRDRPPRWWERAEGGAADDGRGAGGSAAEAVRWAQRSEVAADARFFGLGGRSRGPRLRDGRYRLWNTGAGPFVSGRDPLSVTMPVQLVVADVGTHLVFHDNSWDGEVALREGTEGQGSGHDRPGRCEVRFEGGPTRYWVMVGPPARVLHGWRSLTGAPAVPPRWALGYQHGWRGSAEVAQVRSVAEGFSERGLPLRALHVESESEVETRRGAGAGAQGSATGAERRGSSGSSRSRVFGSSSGSRRGPGRRRKGEAAPGFGPDLGNEATAGDGAAHTGRRAADGPAGSGPAAGTSGAHPGSAGVSRAAGSPTTTGGVPLIPGLSSLAVALGAEGVRLVSVIGPAVRARPGSRTYDSGVATDAFVRDAVGRTVRDTAWPGDSVFPDFTEPRVREWWGELCAERVAQGFAGIGHDMNEPTTFAVFGEPTLSRSARHSLEGRGGDHREAHNVYGLAMARAGFEGLGELRPGVRPFLISRSGWAGMQRYGGTWSGGAVTGWSGLRSALAHTLGLGLCGVPYAGGDIGARAGPIEAELYLRWFQLGAYLPLFRTRTTKWSGRREPWRFGSEVLEHTRTALAERERLLPYLVTLAHLSRRTGAPYVRPLWWQHPRDRALRDCEDAFLLGDALLVAPVLEEGARERTVRLPPGRWYDTASGTPYDGPGQVRVEAPLSRIPVLARGGAAVPVAAEGGGVQLEVWPPAPGRTGSGLLLADRGDGWERPEAERFTVRLRGGATVVERADGQRAGYPVRVRGEPGQARPDGG